MRKPYEIVYDVHDAFRGLPVKLSRMTQKSDTWWRSHGYEPRTTNPESNGNPSDVDGFMAFVELYEAAEPGAGNMLAHRVFAELEARFTENDLLDISQQDLQVKILSEQCDVNKWLASKKLETATRNEHLIFQRECDEAQEAIAQAKSRSVALMRQIEMSRRQVSEIQDERAARAR